MLLTFGAVTSRLAAFATNKHGKTAYVNGDSGKAFIYYLYGYALGELEASRSLEFLVQKGMIGDIPLAMDSKELALLFKLDIIRAQVHLKDKDKYKQINRVADTFHFGVMLDRKEMGTAENSFSLYQHCHKISQSLYAKLSLAYMYEMGEGTLRDAEKALSYYWSILEDSLSSKSNHENSVFLPALGRLCVLKVKSFIDNGVNLWSSFISYIPSFIY